jgi:glycyl-tRNA synthetase
MQKSLDFQTIIMTLQRYWAEMGCLVWQPYYTQVGAGTMNPATYLRVLGPEPWNVAYVEPSVRPDDGRYGDNPYRFQQHYQFQVILKPDPGNPQELYLQSLQALGIDPAEHDIRFVEDNWESPALGAWGLGWEVWLDGQEITQFTYFQQAGGINLEPVSVEITYGLERIAMALQGNYHFKKIRWNENIMYGDINYMGEKEHSTYYFEIAGIDRLREMYDLFEKEAELALVNGLVLPAHDYILKCSHTFNILDTRGAVGVTERQALFGRMRELARRAAETYAAQREQLGYPWLGTPAIAGASAATKEEEKTPSASSLPEKADFLLEIGTEELPAADLRSALDQLQESVPAMLDALRLDHGAIQVLGTPRRLAVYVKDLAGRQDDQVSELKGPPADRAFDQEGNPTSAALGFARSKGISIDQLQKKEIDGGEYLVVELHLEGKPISEVLPEKLTELIADIRFNKSMRWNESGVSFSRPIRWLVSLFDDFAIPFTYADLTAGKSSRGLRFSETDQHTLENAPAYFNFLASQKIIANADERKELIKKQVMDLLASVDAAAEIDAGLLDEVNNLVEAPTALLGTFNETHLQLPAEVLVGVMKKHQRYFPVYSKQGELMPYFITVRNGSSQHLDIVARGNEEVIQARFADAAFFMREDSSKTLEEMLPRLESLIFQPALGSMRAKSDRVLAITKKISKDLGLSDQECATAERAAYLSKADLATNMVVEMTSLQGTIGKFYALRDGETPQVAQAIEEHYMPRQAGGQSPQSKPGVAVAIADRLDSIVGLFAVNMAPTGTKDPFGLRRAAIGLLQNLLDFGEDFDLRMGIDIGAENQPVPVTAEHRQAVFDFIVGRLQNMLLDNGYRYDAVNAVLAAQGNNPAAALRAVQSLEKWAQNEDWNEILPAFSRCVRITRDLKQTFTIKPESLVMQPTKDLLAAVEKAEAALEKDRTIDSFVKAIKTLTPTINMFFDQVLVMDKDEQIKNNRLAILQRVSGLSAGLADLSHMEGF